jgi:hypothetical protein
MNSDGVNSEAFLEELRRIEGEVVQGERQLADREALLVTSGGGKRTRAKFLKSWNGCALKWVRRKFEGIGKSAYRNIGRST